MLLDENHRGEKVFDDGFLVYLQNYLSYTADVPLPPVDATEPVNRSTSLSPVKHLTISWHNIHVYLKNTGGSSVFRKCWIKDKADVETGREKKQILKNVNGVVYPGELLAIMGASGAGKTTLMNVLTNRNRTSLDVEGEVRVNGRIVDRSIARHCSYVQQDDLFIGTLTVKEHLTFQALLRMDKDLTKIERMKKLEDVILELGLSKCKNSRIGTPGIKGSISGGERKRLAFASEVLTNPSIMFCDEPTSGLDSFMSQSVVSVLRKLAAGGRTIICTIHQPSSEVYALFNNLLLMAEGRVAYMGRSEGAIAFFEKMGLRLPANYNPSDFFIHNLAIVPGDEKESHLRVQEICDEFAKQRTENGGNEQSGERDKNSKHLTWEKTCTYKASICQQLKVVMWRSLLTTSRDKRATWTRLLLAVVVGSILGTVYWKQELNQKNIMNINGVLFLSLINMSYNSMLGCLNSFCGELPVFLRENRNGMYRTSIYFMCKTIAEIPICFIVPLIFVSITYWMMGMYDLHGSINNFLVYFAIIYLASNTANSFGYLLSCAAGNLNIALGFSSPLMFTFVVFGGYFINTDTLPLYVSWLKYFSWLYYCNQALIVNQWQDIYNISCTTGESRSCISNGKAVIHSFNFDEDKYMEYVVFTAVLLVFYRLVAYIFLLLRSNKSR